MNRNLKPFEYFEPNTVKETIDILSMYGGKAKVLAGGTDLLVEMKRGKIGPQYIIYIKNIPELDYIKYSQEEGLRIGALTTHATIADSHIIRDRFELLATACKKVGTPQVRNVGTIGGNICQGGPSQDTIPSLLVLNAKLKLLGPHGERVVPVDKFFIGPFRTAIDGAELLTEIQIPALPSQSGGCYRWITKRTTADETLVGVAVLIVADSTEGICKDIRIGLCSVAPTPFRAKRAEELLRGKNFEQKLLEEVVNVVDDEATPRSRENYRRKMAKVLTKRAIEEVWQRINNLKNIRVEDKQKFLR